MNLLLPDEFDCADFQFFQLFEALFELFGGVCWVANRLSVFFFVQKLYGDFSTVLQLGFPLMFCGFFVYLAGGKLSLICFILYASNSWFVFE